MPADARRRPSRATRLAVGLLIAAAPGTFAADADAQTLPVLSIDSPSVNEGDAGSTNLNFTVTLSAASTSQVTVAYADAGTGTATSGTDYTALAAGTLTFAPGTTSQTIAVSVTGDTNHESHETVVVTLSNPTNATVSSTAGSGTGTIRDDEGLTVSVDSPTVAEGDSGSTNMNFTVSLSASSTQRVDVIFGITGGTATAGTDYTTSLTNNRIRLRFSPGQTSKTVTVAVQGDTLDEPDETVVAQLSGVSFRSGARIGTGTGTGTITDDDPLPTLSVDSPSVTEGDSGSKDMTFTVSLSAASGREVRTGYAIYPGDGTATSGTDYTAIDGFRFLTFAPGETSKTFTVEVLGDTDPEADETVGVRLAAGPTNAVIGGNGRGVGTITDDDLAWLRTGPASVTEGDAGSTDLTFTLTLVAASGKTVTVDYADTGRGTATSGTDYTALAAGTVTFSPGDTSETITVSVTGDPVVERHETVVLSLSNPTNARFLTASMNTVTGTIRDDDGFPTADAGPDQTVAEGATVTLSGSGSDPDGTPVSGYRWTQTAGPAVTLTSATTATTSFTAPTGLTADETLRFSLVVTSGYEGGSDSVDVLVDAATLGWTAEAGPDQTVDEDDAVTLSGRTLSGGADLTLQGVMQPGYSWRHTAGGASTVRLTGAATATPSFTAPNLLANDDLTFTLTVTVGNDTMTDTVVVTVQADNDDPTAEAGPDQTVYEASAVRLDGRRSFDPEGESLSWSWSQTGGSPNVTLTGANTATPGFTAPLTTVDVTLTFTLTVTAGGATDTDTVAVTVEPLVLMADAGPDQVVGEGDTVRLDGRRSTAPLGAPPLTWSWSQTGGSPAVTLTGADTATPSFTAPSGLTADVTLTFELTVYSGESSVTETDTVDVTVEWVGPVFTPPETDGPTVTLTVDAGPDQTVDEGDAVSLSGSASLDPDAGETLIWSWSQTGGSPAVTLTGADTATPGFTAPNLPADGTLTFTLKVTALGTSIRDTVDVTVRADNDGPAADAGPDRTVDEDDAVRLDGSGSSDPEGEPLSWSWSQTGGSPAVTLTGADTATPGFTAPNLTADGTLTFTLTVTAGDDRATDTVNVTVRADNDGPAADAGPDRTVDEDDAVRLDGSGSSDPEGEPLSWSWSQTGGSPAVTLTGADTAAPGFTAPNLTADGTLTFTLTVTAGDDRATDTVDVTVRADNDGPAADAGPDRTVDEDDAVRLDGSGSSDPEGEPLSWSWSQTGGSPAVTLTGADTATPGFTAPNLTADGTLTFTLTVTAGDDRATDTVDVTVRADNDGPAADAGPDQVVDEGDAVRLDGSGSSDPEGEPLSWSWSQTGDSPAVTLTGADTATPGFTAPSGLTEDLTLTFMLTVTAGGATATDTVDVTVEWVGRIFTPALLTADAGPDQVVDEDDAVRLDGSGSSAPEGETLSWSWSQTGGSPAVTLTGADTAAPGFTAPNLTADGTLTFTLTVTAGDDRATDTVNVTVRADNDGPAADAGPDQVVDEGDAVRLDGSGSSDPEGEPLSWSWSQTGGGPAVMLTGADTAAPGFTAPNLTADETLTFTLTVTAGDDRAADTVDVTVRAVNQPPEITAPGDRTYRQGERITPFIIAVSDPDGDAVSVEVAGLPPGLRYADGRVEGTVAADAAVRAHPVTVTASDGAAAPVRATFTVTVAEDRKPTFGSASVPAQRYRAGSEIEPLTLPAAAGGDGPLRYALTPHAPAPGLVYTAPGSAGASTTGGVIAGVPAAAQAAVRCTLTATDADGDTATLTFTVEVRPDLRPSFADAAPVSRQYRAGRPAGGPPLPAAAGGDPPLRYDVAPALPAGLRFDGASRTFTGTPTAEQQPAPWTLTATDADGDTATLEVTIAVLDPPVVTGLRLVSQPASGDTYGYGEAVALELAFSEPVEVTGAPTLELTVGPAVRTARLTGAGGPRLRFGYRVSETDLDEDGVSVPADALALGGGRITDAAGTAAELEHAGLADQAGHRADGRPRAVGTLRTVTLVLGGAPARVDLSGAFRAAETYAAAVGDGSLAAVEVDGSSAVVTGLAEGTTTVTVTGRNAGGAAEQRFGVVVETAAAEREVMVSTLAGVGRSLLAGTAETVGRRLEGSGGGTAAQASVAGRMLPLGSGAAAAAARTGWPGPGAGGMAAAGGVCCAGAGPAAGIGGAAGLAGAQVGRLTGEELLFGSAFTFSGGGTGQAAAGDGAGAGAGGGPRWTAWGAGARQSFRGTAGPDSTYDGRPATAAAGVDVERGRLLAGVAVARSVAEAAYVFRDAAADAGGQGEVSTRLVTAQPYARWSLDDRTSVWGVFGAGRGEAALTRSVTTAAGAADLAVLMGLGGVRRELGQSRGLDLALRGDVGGVWLKTGAGGGLLAEQRVAVHQSRLGLEIARAFGTGLAWRPFAAVSGRYDGGAGAAGTGLEVAGGLRAADGSGRIEVEASGRVLALSTGSGYRERGASVRARLTPGGDAGRGLSVELTPRWGAPAFGADTLWRDQALGAAGIGLPETGSLDARVGYRLGLLAPFAEMGWARQDAQRQRFGLRVGEVGDAVDVEVTGERHASTARPPDYRFTLFGRIEFRPW